MKKRKTKTRPEKECLNSPDGKHVFSPDYEKDSDGSAVSCEYCGLDKFDDEMDK